MKVEYFFDEATATFTYIVTDEKTNKCAIIDSVFDYNPYSGKTSTNSCDKIIDYITKNNLDVEWILDTHAHADHLTGTQYLCEKFNAKKGIGVDIKKVLDFWKPIFNAKNDMPSDATQFGVLFKEGDVFTIGNLEVKVIHTPGHTPACLSYIIEDCAFVGDTLLMPHIGTARTDFPGGSAKELYHSIQKLLSLPDDTKIYICHDYPPEGEKPSCVATVAEHKKNNSMVSESVTEAEYVTARNKKDIGKEVPKLLLPSIQFNLRAGSFGDKEDNGINYIKIPIDQL